MTPLVIVAIVLIVSLLLNAAVTRWSTRRVLGLDVSMAKSVVIVAARSAAALLAGLAVGFAIRSTLGGETDLRSVQIAGALGVAALSFAVYWVLLGKITGQKVAVWGMTKTVATESVVMLVAIVGLALVLSAILVAAGIDLPQQK